MLLSSGAGYYDIALRSGRRSGPSVSVRTIAGDATPVSPQTTKRLSGGLAAEFKVEAPGAYRVSLKSWDENEDTKTAAPGRSGTVDIEVE